MHSLLQCTYTHSKRNPLLSSSVTTNSPSLSLTWRRWQSCTTRSGLQRGSPCFRPSQPQRRCCLASARACEEIALSSCFGVLFFHFYSFLVYVHTHTHMPYSPHSTLSDSIMNNPLGHVTPRNGGGSLLFGLADQGSKSVHAHYTHDYINPDYCRSGNFHIINNSHKKFLSTNFFFNKWRLQYGQAPGEFLLFSLLPGIRRARDRWL